MKKALALLILTMMVVICFVSCDQEVPQNPAPEHTHNFEEWSITKYATCIEDGVKTRYCACGEQQSDTIPSTGHEEQLLPAKEATCIETGLTEGKKCSNCGEVLLAQQETPLKAHSEVVDAAIDATCTSTGLTEGSHCSECGAVLISQREIPVEAHTYDDEYDADCNKCGHVRDVECPHTETEIVAGYEATCTSAGLTDGSNCKNCGEILVQQTVIETKDHTEVIDEAVEPTCTSTGLTEGKHCSVCGTTIIAQVGIPMLEHSYAPLVTAPTCTQVGYTTYTCDCGEYYIDDYTDKSDHIFGEWVVVKEATETEEGLRERYCVCTMIETEIIPVKPLYVRDGNYIYFGEYPQTIKADDVTITSTIDNRGYYLGSDGNYYAKIVSNRSGTFSTGSTMALGRTYYFKVEPIRWKILHEEDGTALILCDIVISSVSYQPDYEYSWSDERKYTTANGAPEGTFANNYEYSNVRKWLIDEFYNTAFSELQQELILITEVDNSESSFADVWGTTPTDNFAGENTFDKVFLLSASEVMNSDYGFTTHTGSKPLIRASDYAQAMGTQCMQNRVPDYWMLRSPGIGTSGSVMYIGSQGGLVPTGFRVELDNYGIIPALRIQL